MASSKGSKSSHFDKERKRSTKGKGKEKRLTALEDGYIIATRVEKAFKRWKTLQSEIQRKQERVNSGISSKRLEPFKNERDELVEQMKKDIPELQSIFDDEYGSAFDRKDKRRTTTGGMIKEKIVPENRGNHRNEISTLEHRFREEIKNLEEDKERKSEEYRNEISALENRYQEEIKNLVEDKERLKRKLDESENEKVALKLSHNEEIGAQKEKIRKLEERLTIDKSSYEKREKELKTKCDELKADIASYKENWTKSEDAKIQLDIKITALEEEKRRTEGELKRLEAKNNQLTNQLGNERKAKEDALLSLEEEKRSTEGELKRTQALYDQLRTQHENERKDNEDARLRLEAKNNQLTNQLGNERKAKEDAFLRLSSMASNKLRDNNPNIADLSDPNRPTKLSEQFSELYDNEWTDAFDELEKLFGDKDDKEIISYLRDFILEIHSICSDISSSKLKTIEEAFVKPSEPSEDSKIPTEIFKTIKDGIKSMAPKLLEHTRKHVLGHLEEKYLTDPVKGYLQHQNVKRYIDKCTEVCWYMSVQDPQLVMDGSKSPDEKFDSNKHREYTKKGPHEEFVVWPVLYLYRGGQMLSKGVAQGGKKMTGQ